MKKIGYFILFLLVLGQANADVGRFLERDGSWFLYKSLDTNDNSITYAIHNVNSRYDIFSISCRIPYYTDPYYHSRYQVASISYEKGPFLSSDSKHIVRITRNQMQSKKFKVKAGALHSVEFDSATDLIKFIRSSNTIDFEIIDVYLFKRGVIFDMDGFSQLESKLDKLCKYEQNS
ncbi:hypothetical protein PT276_00545 [Orbaceae bacterium ESL0721]|nr:hypothetical protein [Orbaceae bacterium ESL0721]